MAVPTPKRPFTDEQMRHRLKRLNPDQQYEFLRCSEALFTQESDQYLSALADSRMAFADAMMKVRDELRSESEEEDGEAKERDNPGPISENMSTLFDTSTELGQNMAAIGSAFASLLHKTKTEEPDILELVKVAEQKAMSRYMEEMNIDGSFEDIKNEATDDVKSSSGKKKKKKKSKQKHDTASKGVDTGVIESLKKNLVEDLDQAAREEQEALLERMRTHGVKIDQERRRQQELVEEKRREANEKRGKQLDTARAEMVDEILDKKQEMDNIHEEERIQREKALQKRLEERRKVEDTDGLKSNASIGADPSNEQTKKTDMSNDQEKQTEQAEA